MQSSLFNHEEGAAAPMAWDHATLAILPVTVANREAARGQVVVERQFTVDGRNRRVAITLAATHGTELPSHADGQVLLALLQLTLQQDPPPQRLVFRRSEVLEILGLSDGGPVYERLAAALRRLAGVLVHVRSELVSRDGRPYGRREGAAHLVEAYEIGDGYSADCWVRWGSLVEEAIVLGDFKRLDLPMLLRIPPLAGQLYRLLDRVVLSGETEWRVGWHTLADLLGMNADAYSRPARFRQVLEPHLQALIDNGVIDSWKYERGGTFIFQVHNELRATLRRVLEELGVYPEAARQLVAAHDEARIMAQCDHLQHGAHPAPESPGGWLTEAIRKGWELRYPDDDRDAFCALWSIVEPEDQAAVHRAAVRLCDLGGDLFASQDDPAAWPIELRAVCRFMVSHGVDAGA